jgi:predicted nucleic acid-binding protein
VIKTVMLDTGPLGRIAYPRRNSEIMAWVDQLQSAGIIIVLPEIADYELRRNFLLEGLTSSLTRLDQLKSLFYYLPLNTKTMMKAAELWADARRRGRPMADPKELDGDVILAAQAIQLGAVIATENVGHLSLFVEARLWRQIASV